MQAVLSRAARDSHDPSCQAGPKSATPGRPRVAQGIEKFEGLGLHARLQSPVAPGSARRVAGQWPRPGQIVGGQAFDAQSHVGQASGGIEARSEDEAEVEAVAVEDRARRRQRARRGQAAGVLSRGRGSWLTRMRLLRSRRTTSATVPRATRSRRLPRLGSGAVGEPVPATQLGARA